jgi:ATP-dependent Lon protease
VFLATQKKAGIDNPEEKRYQPPWVPLAKCAAAAQLPDGTVKALVEGKARGRILQFRGREDFFQVEIRGNSRGPDESTAENVA